MQLDFTLNIVWLVLGVLAFGLTFGVSRRRAASKGWRLAGLVLVLAAIFPFISATDDILRLDRYASQHNSDGTQRTTTGDDLVRLYEAMDAPLVPNVSGIAFVLLFVLFVSFTTEVVLTRFAPKAFGRSPPAFFSATT